MFHCLHLALLLCVQLSHKNDAAMGEKLTDEGLSALAAAGCGAHLTSLHLEGGWFLSPFRCSHSRLLLTINRRSAQRGSDGQGDAFTGCGRLWSQPDVTSSGR